MSVKMCSPRQLIGLRTTDLSIKAGRVLDWTSQGYPHLLSMVLSEQMLSLRAVLCFQCKNFQQKTIENGAQPKVDMKKKMLH